MAVLFVQKVLQIFGIFLGVDVKKTGCWQNRQQPVWNELE